MGNRQSQRKKAEEEGPGSSDDGCGHLTILLLLKKLFFRRTDLSEEESTVKAPTFPFVSPGFPTSSSISPGDQYDVFLSFRGLDTRNEFADRLYHELVGAGSIPIMVFKDDISIPIGEEFSSQILNAIERSKILIPIISENYVLSKWCLIELFHMMKCKNSTSQVVLPIFYKVTPGDVRHLQGNFGTAFHSRKGCFDRDVEEVRKLLKEVSYLHGWECQKIANRGETELVRKIVKNVLNKLQPNFRLDVAKDLCGIDDHVIKIRKWIETPASDARMIGLYGMAGIGKTTLAKVIYNALSNDFENRSFLKDIRGNACCKHLHDLQNQLIKEILPFQKKVYTDDAGISLIKSRFKGKKVLILLDEIDRIDQLDALARENSWFALGSIIIITTENKSILDQSKFGVVYEHKVSKLDEKHSLLLFNSHAFRMNNCPRDFEGISRAIVSTTDGHPLALEAIGKHLHGKTNLEIWRDMQMELEKVPHEDVQNVLRISYGALKGMRREIFLDIACFLIGEVSKFAIYMWKDCGFYPNLAIEELTSRCLIEIDEEGKLRMHGQLRDFGRNIVRQEGLPVTRSRLWLYEEASRVLVGGKGSHTDKQFENLESLRSPKLRRAALSGDFDQLFSELKWLHLFDIDPDLPISAKNLHLRELVVLQLSDSRITDRWEGWTPIKEAKRLKVLELARCENLRCTPDFSTFTDLEVLVFKHCGGLEKVHHSIDTVKSLVSLDLSYCILLEELPSGVGNLVELKELILDFSGVTKFPRSIGSLKKLEKLSVRGCRSLREIPSEFGDLSSLKILEISSAPLSYLPGSISQLSSLQYLKLQDCLKLQSLPPFSGLTHLMVSHHCPGLSRDSCLVHQDELGVKGCDLLECIPKRLSRYLKLCVVSCHKLILPIFHELKYLEELSIEKSSSIDRVDLSQLKHLKRLCAKYCDNLVEIRADDSLEFLEEIVISHCRSIETLNLPELWCLKQLKANSCDDLVKIQGLDRAKSLETLHISDCGSIKELPELSCFATLKELNINGCGNLLDIETLERFSSCRSMYITGCKSLKKLPNLSKFLELENFTMRYSLDVTEIPGIEESRSLTYIEITGCESMKTLPDLSGCLNLLYLVVQDCKNLTQIQGLERLGSIYLDISGCGCNLSQVPGTSLSRHFEGWQSELFCEKKNLSEMIMLR